MFKEISKDISLVLICSYVIKLMVTGATYADGIALLVLGAYGFASKYYSRSAKDEEFEKRISFIEEESKKSRTALDTLKLSMGLRQGNGR